MSVCLSVTPVQIAFSFLFLDEIEPFWPSVLHVALYKTVFFDLVDLGPLTPKIYSPIFGTKSYKSASMADRSEMLDLLGSFRGWPSQWNHAKCCGPTLVAMTMKFALGTQI